ncbi:hypothetical protein [Cellulomonas taurus]|uniref:hypothetical protein n=1 Tax=Cellulomonas taurus TaxID=2729175 RepID=UPI00145EF8DA|nr:hypothetical protein [Cellulomonas taurus]
MTARTRRRILTALMLAAALVSAACTDDSTAEPSPTGPPYPVADIAPLEPALDAAAPFEDHPAVQIMRTTSMIGAWSTLIGTREFAQYTQYFDPAREPDLRPAPPQYRWIAIGPKPRVIVSVTDNADGSTVVRSCGYTTDEVSKDTGEPRDYVSAQQRGLLVDTTLSPLTDEEIARLTDLGLDPPALWVRGNQTVTGDCDPSSATVQHFADWREYAPIGHYS